MAELTTRSCDVCGVLKADPVRIVTTICGAPFADETKDLCTKCLDRLDRYVARGLTPPKRKEKTT